MSNLLIQKKIIIILKIYSKIYIKKLYIMKFLSLILEIFYNLINFAILTKLLIYDIQNLKLTDLLKQYTFSKILI